ncbi:GNAT family N-acetyltransferase [Nonomuraea sediminis]|uniref:GNAT family N-acetyltransferase n=1 Tax=Nonomuraea sediminis TaxID=2835864 RepID=UPI001BDC15B1|nr:GNAT family N-acetyltransferase [Nonomuraea sediminis]
MSPFEIRPASPADSQEIEDVRITTWKTAYRGVMTDSFLEELSVSPAMVDRRSSLLSDGSTRGFVAVRDGRVRGFTLYGKARDDGHDGMEVYAIYVLPEEFSTGMGRALMAASLEDLHGQEVGLWVLAGNPRARRFYERCGFTASGLVKTESDPPLEQVHYRRAAST